MQESLNPQPPHLTHAPSSPATHFSPFCCLHIFTQPKYAFVGFGQCLALRNLRYGAGLAVCSQRDPEPSPALCSTQGLQQPRGCTGQRCFSIYFLQFSLTHGITVKDDCSFLHFLPFLRSFDASVNISVSLSRSALLYKAKSLGGGQPCCTRAGSLGTEPSLLPGTVAQASELRSSYNVVFSQPLTSLRPNRSTFLQIQI